MKTRNSQYWQRGLTLVDGCTPVSEGCEHCWSANISYRFKKHRRDGCSLTDRYGNWHGEIETRVDRLDIPLKTRKPTIFSIWNDLFHEQVPIKFIGKALQIMKECPQHMFLILTKRASRLEIANKWRVTHEEEIDKIPANIYLGITAENQQRLEERLPYLLQVPGKRFLSIEPLLDKVNLLKQPLIFTNIHQVIAGAETGHHASPCNLDWIRSIRDQCEQAGIPFFLKQINARRERALDGKEYNHLVWRI